MPYQRGSAIQPEQFATFGQLLRFLRQRAGLTQRELSIAVGYSESQISRLEKNQRAPDQAILAARFVPALHLGQERGWTARLLTLAAAPQPAAPPDQPAKHATAAPPTPHNLPIQLTSFIGRAPEIAEVKDRLTEARLVTLTGSGGCGKTRLALQVAGDLLSDYPDGVWWLEFAPLSSLSDPGLIPQVLAAALGVREELGQPLLTTATEFLRPRRALLILDNCEHLIDACAHLAEALLRAGPHLRLLATSREALGVPGETAQRVPSLAGPDPGQPPDLARLARWDAVRLFVERAALAQPQFTLTAENAPAVAQICQRLDGIPLALELAATRVKALAVEQIAARLDDSFHLLTGGSRTALPRQQTLRATMDWSHSLLTEPERRLFRRLAVFSGTWSLEAAEAVCAGAGLEAAAILDTLTRLIDKSLVQAEELAGEMRYSRLETVRQYAREKLVAAQEHEPYLDQHLNFYLQQVQEAEPWLDAGQQTEWYTRLEIDQDNLRAALEWACVRQPETARWLAGLLRWFWITGDHLTEARTRYAQTLGLTDLIPPTTGAAFALQGAGMAAAFLFLFNEAILPLEQSAAAWRALDDRPRLAECLWVLGYAYASLGKNARACELFADNEALFRQSAPPKVLAITLGHWSMAVAKLKQDYAAAREHAAAAIKADPKSEEARLVLGMACLNVRDNAPAVEAFTAAIKLNDQLAFAYDRRGDALLKLGLCQQRLADLTSQYLVGLE